MADSSLKSQAESTPTPQRGVKRKIDRTTEPVGIGGTEDIPAGTEYHAKLSNASDYASIRIIRAFTPEQAQEYKALTGRGAQQKKTEMRIHLASMAQKLGKASGLQTNTLSDVQSDVKIGKFCNFWMLVTELGGTVNMDIARREAIGWASNVAEHCERAHKRGIPAIMWDEPTGAMAPR